MKSITLLLAGLAIALSSSFGQYKDYSTLEKQMTGLSGKYSTLNMEVLTKTDGDRNIYVLTASKGKAYEKSGIVLIGGVEGTNLASREMVIKIAEKVAADKTGLLDDMSFYFIPDMTPDASEQYFSGLKYERRENARAYDDDRDGKFDEDGFDDLNKDGIISYMRVADDVKGEWIEHPDFPAVLIKADKTKSEKGKYLLLREGFDNDKDGVLNEDGPGGVIVNKNFTFNYQNFEQGAGENPLSETESRALADFLFSHWNVFAVVFIGPENNLSELDEFTTALHDKAIPAMLSKEDKPYFEQVVNSYNSDVKLNNPSKVSPEGGALLSWTYFHYNRFAFSTPAWNVPSAKDSKSDEADYLKWAAENNIQDVSLEWKEFNHPDFPGKKVEIGGIKPFMIANPPYEALDSISDQHYNFLAVLAKMKPAIEIRILKSEKKSGDLYEVKAEILNSGQFPLMTKLAERSSWVKKLRVDLLPSASQEIVGGKKVNLINQLMPGESVELTWLVKGKGELKIEAGSPQTSNTKKLVNLN